MQKETATLEVTRLVEEPKSMKKFWVIFTGQAFSLFGSRLVQFTLIWWLTTVSGSASVLALGSIMAILPQVFISPFAGAVIDRWNRRTVMILVDAMIASTVVVLAVLFARGTVEYWYIFALMFVRAAGGAFHWPAMQASTSLMVPKDQLSRVAGLNQALFGLASIIAPALGALLLGVLPMQSILAIDVATAGLAIVPLLFIWIPQPQLITAKEKVSGWTSVISDMKEGLRFVLGWRGILLIMGMAMVFNLLAVPAISLTPLLITEHFLAGSQEYAILEAAFGMGVVVGGLLLGAWGGFKSKVVTGLSAAILMGIGTMLVGLAPSNLYWVAFGGMSLFGLMNPIVNGSMFSLLQSTVPPEKQGRIFTLLMSGSSAMAPIGLSFAGPLADVMGVRVWFLAGGLVIAMMGAGAFFVPDIIGLEKKGIEGEHVGGV